LRGWLRDEPLEECCRFGNACGAMVVTRHGCAPAMPTWVELQLFLSVEDHRAAAFVSRLDHVHWASTRRRRYPELMILAIDHRSQFEELAGPLTSARERISRFKSLGLRALDAAAARDARCGVLLDGRYAADALAEAADLPYWIGRPIEIPQSRPVEFEGAADVAAEIATWPLNHVVKSLVIYHPDDAAPLRERQERQLKRLFDACRKTRHEWLLEIILPKGVPADAGTTDRALQRIYALNVRPDWWKLAPSADTDHWRAIQATIVREDPLCRGVLLLGQAASEAELIAGFEAAAPVEVVKGFAIGRSIFHDVARAWLAGSMSDSDACEAMAHRFSGLVSAWRKARAVATA
jgi:5-dehydro-2-deoxygluconokinase